MHSRWITSVAHAERIPVETSCEIKEKLTETRELIWEKRLERESRLSVIARGSFTLNNTTSDESLPSQTKDLTAINSTLSQSCAVISLKLA